MSLQEEFENKVTRLDEDSRIVRIHQWEDAQYFAQRKELGFNAMLFYQPLTNEERRDAVFYVRNSNKSQKGQNGKYFRSSELLGHFDKAVRKTVPRRLKTVPIPASASDCIDVHLREEVDEQGLSERLHSRLMALTQKSYDILMPDDSAEVQKIRKALKGREMLVNTAIYHPYSAFLRVNSTEHSNPHIHEETMIWPALGSGPICYDEMNTFPVYQPVEGEILIHDETFYHGADPKRGLGSLTYVVGKGW